MDFESHPIWVPSEEFISKTQMNKFIEFVCAKTNSQIKTYWDLYDWSISDLSAFWSSFSKYANIKWHNPPQKALYQSQENDMLSAQWFPSATLNYAQHLLVGCADGIVVTSICEGRADVNLSSDDLRVSVAAFAQFLRQKGVKQGDRIAGVVPNTHEALIAMLATSSLGAIWSSCSPDFGVQGIVDRFSQIEPKVLIYTSSYQYHGKKIDCLNALDQVMQSLPSVQVTAIIDPLGDAPAVNKDYPVVNFQGIMNADIIEDLKFESLPFDHPLFIMFSSGTTGVPKCIVHSVGGTLIQHLKELILHCDLKQGDKLLYFTTCGWMMWNWMVSALATGSSLVLFEGSPAYPSLDRLWGVLDDHKVSVFGTSPKFLSSCAKEGLCPKDVFDLSSLRTILSTGAPLLPEQFDWVSQEVGSHIQLCSISGGTDIISCFMLGVPILPVYRGEIQAPGLGMAIESWHEGRPVEGERGELVCTKAFPSMPIGFWQDVDNQKYRKAYFNRFGSAIVWHHGDYISLTSHRGIIVHGRSDATLNPGGVRIGTAEIYRVVEKIDTITDSLAVSRQLDGDVEIILFVKLRSGTLDKALLERIQSAIVSNLTPRHKPRKIISAPDIPYTRSGKKLEIPVSDILNGKPVVNESAISNPQSLQFYRDLAKKLS